MLDFFLSPFAPKSLVSRDRFGRSVPRLPVHFPHPGRLNYESGAPVSRARSYIFVVFMRTNPMAIRVLLFDIW